MLPEVCYDRAPLSRHYADASRTDNFYGHPAVVRAIQEVAKKIRSTNPSAPRLPVQELGNRKGGKIPFHLSHRNGLDVDIAYLSRADRRHPIPLCHEGPKYEWFDGDEWKVREQFALDLNWAMVAEFAKREDVRMIFVGGVVKKALLEWAEANAPPRERRRTAKKLVATYCRAPTGVQMGTYRNNRCPHDDHIHVRFACPADSPRCRERRAPRRDG